MSDWGHAMMAASGEVLADLTIVLDAGASDEDSTIKILPVVSKYSRLVVMRDALPHALLALQYHATTPKLKEALTAALTILAQARGEELSVKAV